MKIQIFLLLDVIDADEEEIQLWMDIILSNQNLKKINFNLNCPTEIFRQLAKNSDKLSIKKIVSADLKCEEFLEMLNTIQTLRELHFEDIIPNNNFY